MRLTNKEIKIIKTLTLQTFKDAIIYIFGSRIDDNKRGGDIDIGLVVKDKKNLIYKKLLLKSKLKQKLNKPINLIIIKNNNSLIEKEILKGIKL